MAVLELFRIYYGVELPDEVLGLKHDMLHVDLLFTAERGPNIFRPDLYDDLSEVGVVKDLGKRCYDRVALRLPEGDQCRT